MSQSDAPIVCNADRIIPDNYKQAWEMFQGQRELIRQQQQDEFRRTVGVAHYCVERFRVKGTSQIREKHENGKTEAKAIFYAIQDLTNSLGDSCQQIREEEREPTPQEADQIATMQQQFDTQKSNLERTLPDVRSYLDTKELKSSLEDSLPFQKEEVNEDLL